MFDWLDDLDIGAAIGGALALGTTIYGQVTAADNADAARAAAEAQARAAQANAQDAQAQAAGRGAVTGGLLGLSMEQVLLGLAAVGLAIFLSRG